MAVSGGADSAMLAVHAAAVARERGAGVALLHVHHGLQAAADGWRDQVEALAGLLELPLRQARVEVDAAGGKGIEAAARERPLCRAGAAGGRGRHRRGPAGAPSQ